MFHTNYDETTRTWYGQPTAPLFHPNVSVAQVVLGSLRRRPHHLGQVSDSSGVRLSNRMLRLNAIRAAEHLALLGVGEGDVLALVAKNHHHVAAVVVAAMALAAPVNTLDPHFTCDEIVHMLRLTQPKVLFCDADNIATVREALGVLDRVVPIFTFDRKVDGARVVDDLLHETGTEELFLPAVLSDGTKQAAAIICSSGTTGAPKGVALSHASLLEQMWKIFSLQSDDVLLCFSSLYWISGMASLLSGMLQGITRIITSAPFSAAAMLRCVAKYRVTVAMTAPAQLGQLLQQPQLLADSDLSTLMRYYVAGGALAPELAQRINAHLPADVRNVYGMSEVGGKISANTVQTARDPGGSAGLLIEGIRVRVMRIDEDAGEEDGEDGGDDDDEEEAGDNISTAGRCIPDEDGEICVQLRPPFIGYWRDEAATAAAFTADGQWFCTGDIGHFDEAGRLHVVDRRKDIMKFNGWQVSPSELEALVLAALPGVAAVCVVGVPDAMLGELPAAVVVRNDAIAADADEAVVVSEADVVEVVERRLSDEKRLRGGVYFVEQLPVTHSGKVLRRAVREMVMEMFNARRLAEMEL